MVQSEKNNIYERCTFLRDKHDVVNIVRKKNSVNLHKRFIFLDYNI